jgi:hypothetical protein
MNSKQRTMAVVQGKIQAPIKPTWFTPDIVIAKLAICVVLLLASRAALHAAELKQCPGPSAVAGTKIG